MTEIEKLFDELHEIEAQYFLTSYNQNSFNSMREKFINILSNRLEKPVSQKLANAKKQLEDSIVELEEITEDLGYKISAESTFNAITKRDEVKEKIQNIINSQFSG